MSFVILIFIEHISLIRSVGRFSHSFVEKILEVDFEEEGIKKPGHVRTGSQKNLTFY
jgi:hypothetical protein